MKSELKIDLPPAVVKSIGKYDAMGIEITLLEQGSKGGKPTLTWAVKQTRKDTDRVLTNKELHDRAKDALAPIANEYALQIRPVVWSGPEIEDISAAWVHSKLAKHGMNQSDLVELLNIDKHVISKLLNNAYAFTRWHKATFYYLFKSIEGASR
jgi:hypothetical protein